MLRELARSRTKLLQTDLFANNLLLPYLKRRLRNPKRKVNQEVNLFKKRKQTITLKTMSKL